VVFFYKGGRCAPEMGFRLESIVPWGRSFEEYERMFALTEMELAGRILGCGDGPAAFNAELSRRGGRVVSIDPLYAFDAGAIAGRIEVVRPQVMAQLRAHAEDFVWTGIRSPEDLERLRLQAMGVFLADFEAGRAEGRYVAGALPDLPFADDAFDLALCSHFLFLYGEQVSLEIHLRSIEAMLRVAREVRIFPLLELDGAPSRHLEPVRDHLQALGHRVQRQRVAYEFQRGADTLLRVVRGGPQQDLSEAEIEALVADFLALRLPRSRWTHPAHLAVGLWSVRRHGEAEALGQLRRCIRAHNEAVGIVNDDAGGYHETLTRLWLRAIAAHHAAHGALSLADSLAALLRSPLAAPQWPLRHYSPERLFCAQARAGWVEPDRAALAPDLTGGPSRSPCRADPERH
jgi:hypothetical protein